MEWLAFGMTFLGWIIIVTNGRKLAIRSEVHSICNSIIDDLIEVEKNANEVWHDDKEFLNMHEEQKLASQIALVELKLAALKEHYFNHSIENRALFDLRRKCTASSVILEIANEERIREVSTTSIKLRSDLSLKTFSFMHTENKLFGIF